MNFYHYSYYIDTTRKGSGSRKRKKVFLIVKSDNVLDAQYIAENYISKLSHPKNNYELTLTEIKPIENSTDD
jgi:hypothetical protein